ncbi:hypothetical protein L1987_67664 [Smallanthus sonchifolius]|uniref:Uncharacterized protein n=1 Tax=Smallanthus sonchifolius TaxID=185202 RepID=A0ACB9B425_9ASTR|nr:hypothetical protein L1987_67664 [Smallanthus sonchifolius]
MSWPILLRTTKQPRPQVGVFHRKAASSSSSSSSRADLQTGTLSNQVKITNRVRWLDLGALHQRPRISWLLEV